MTKLALVLASFSFALTTGCMTDGLADQGELSEEELALQAELDADLDLDAELTAELDADDAARIATDATHGTPDLVVGPDDEARACGFSTDRWGTSRWKNCTSKHVTVRVDVRLSPDTSVCVKPNSTSTLMRAWGARGAAVSLNGCI